MPISGASPVTAADIWDRLLTAITTGGSIGVLLKTDIDAVLSTLRATEFARIDAILSTLRATEFGRMDAPISAIPTTMVGTDGAFLAANWIAPKSFDTVRVVEDIAAGASYSPPDNHLLAGFMVGDLGVKLQMNSSLIGWVDWVPYEAYALSKLFDTSIACDGANVRLYNSIGTQQYMNCHLMRTV